MTVKQKAAAALVFAVCITLAAAFAARLPGAARWLSAFGRNRKKAELNLGPCAKNAFTLISDGNMRAGLDALALCPASEQDDPRLKIILADFDDSRATFNSIMKDWRPALPSLFATAAESVNPLANDEKIAAIDAFLQKHPDNYYAQLLIFAKAAALFSAGDYSGASKTLDKAPGLPAVRGHAAYLRLYSAINDGDFKTADRLNAELTGGNTHPAMAAEIRLLHAHSLHLRGKSGQAVAEATAVFAAAAEPEVKWHAADLISKIQADTSHPVQSLKALAMAVSASPDAQIDAGLPALIQERGGPYISGAFTEKELSDIGGYLIKNRDFYDALYLMKTAYPAAPPPRINLLIARACTEAGRPCDPDDTLARLEALKSSRDADTARQTCVLRARALLIRKKNGDAKLAESTLKGCIANYPSKPGEAVEQLIKILDERGEDALSVKYIEALVKAEPAYSIDLNIRLARARLLQRKYTSAREAFAAIYKNFPTESYTPAALYWMGRISLERGEKDAACASFAELVRKYPYSYYWFRAGDRLAEAGRKAPSVDAGNTPITDAEIIRDAYAMMDLGYFTEAERMFTTALGRGGIEADAAAIGLARLRRARGDTIHSVKPLEKRIIANQALYTPVMAHPLFSELLFPTLYIDSVKKHSAANSLEPETTLAVIRQESRFDASATSRSNAKGLMQVLPSTGQWIASKRGDASFTVEALYDPDTNIAYGTWYLRYLLKRFDGETVLAVAGYNGGPGTVSRLLRVNGYSDRDFFIESIPKFETRDYTKKVLQNYYVYSQILNKR